jgi:hypothetical protein
VGSMDENLRVAGPTTFPVAKVPQTEEYAAGRDGNDCI